MTRKLYGDPVLIEEIISQLTPSDKFSDVYIDIRSNQSWFKYEVRSMYIGDPLTNLACFPEPTTSELINIAFLSEYHDEVVAASLRLLDNELYMGKEFREELFGRLSGLSIRNLATAEKDRLRKIILLTELSHGENRREVMGKDLSEVKTDAGFFMRIAHQADKLLESLD